MAPQRIPHACPARFYKIAFSWRALALANCDTNDLFSSDQRPPTSIASTTNLARERGPTNSGYVRSLRLLAECNTTPSASAAAELCHVACSLKCLSPRDAASCCQPRRTLPGSRSSGSTFSGRAPSATRHEGSPNPRVPVNDHVAEAASPNDGVSGAPSKFTTNRVATSRCLDKTIGRQCAQLAQKADVLNRTALRNPRPPKTRGMPKMRQRHRHMPSSWAPAQFTTDCGSTTCKR